jgi:cytochrome c553
MATSPIACDREPAVAGVGDRGFLWSLLAVATLLLLCGASAAMAQARKSSTADDLRPAYATATDVAEGKRVADDMCARCHGPTGISATRGVPHVAGQRPSYLYAKIKGYQSGARDDHAMESAVKFLNDDALVKVAAYYASLEPAQPPAADAAKKVAAPLDRVAAGKAAAEACTGCHGETGVSAMPGTPNLVGFEEKYFVAAMNGYKGGQRKHELMKSIAVSLSDADVRNMALHYALQQPARAQTPAKGNAAAGRTASAACAGCHGEQGVSGNPANPSLAGQDAEYFVAAMRAYKDGTRTEETMKLAASGLSDASIADLAAFYAAQQPRQPKVSRPLTLAEWVQRCDRCHGINGNSTDPRTPAIAAQRVEYLQKALQAYQGNQRRNSVMAAMSGSLTDTDVANLSAYYARQKARSFVFVLVPSK